MTQYLKSRDQGLTAETCCAVENKKIIKLTVLEFCLRKGQENKERGMFGQTLVQTKSSKISCE